MSELSISQIDRKREVLRVRLSEFLELYVPDFIKETGLVPDISVHIRTNDLHEMGSVKIIKVIGQICVSIDLRL